MKKTVLTILIAIISTQLQARVYLRQRQECKHIKQQCEQGTQTHSIPAAGIVVTHPDYCQRLHQACMRQELDMNCAQVYAKRSHEQYEQRFQIDEGGRAILGGGAASGGIALGFALGFSNPATAIAGGALIGAGIVIGTPIILLSRIPLKHERVQVMADMEANNFWTHYHTRRFRYRTVNRINERTQHVDLTLEQVMEYTRDGIVSGEFCRDYPRLFNMRQVNRAIAAKADRDARIGTKEMVVSEDSAVNNGTRNKNADEDTQINPSASAFHQTVRSVNR